MDLLTRMSLAIAYVEDNLTSDIDQEVLARIACCSIHNFYRMFSFITDISLTEYIRRRRLTLAAIELQSSDIKVIDLAVKYGYDSPVSLSRSFQTLHGLTPKEARADGVTLKAYPRISFQITIKGEKEMDYRIESKEAFQVFGYECIFRTDGSDLNADILHDNAMHQNNPHELWTNITQTVHMKNLWRMPVTYRRLSAPAYVRYTGYAIINKRNPALTNISGLLCSAGQPHCHFLA